MNRNGFVRRTGSNNRRQRTVSEDSDKVTNSTQRSPSTDGRRRQNNRQRHNSTGTETVTPAAPPANPMYRAKHHMPPMPYAYRPTMSSYSPASYHNPCFRNYRLPYRPYIPPPYPMPPLYSAPPPRSAYNYYQTAPPPYPVRFITNTTNSVMPPVTTYRASVPPSNPYVEQAGPPLVDQVGPTPMEQAQVLTVQQVEYLSRQQAIEQAGSSRIVQAAPSTIASSSHVPTCTTYEARGNLVNAEEPEAAAPTISIEVIATDDLSDVDSQDLESTNNLLDYYLRLPRTSFPAARHIPCDPNLIIDEFCKIQSIEPHVPWLLDLELGPSRVPSTRIVPIYDTRFSGIYCRDFPGMVHPDFANCTPHFRQTLRYYYNYVISHWYRGYTAMYARQPKEVFQNWLQTPLSVFGMCWP